jgi:DNA-nicking Smr family endonuclease
MSKERGPKVRGLSDDDDRMWQAVTRSVTPLRKRPARPKSPEQGMEKATAAPRKAAPLATAAVAPAKPKTSSLPRNLERKLKSRIARGTHAIDARIDLHGMTQSQAHSVLLRFLRGAQAREARTVLVITGKGGRGEGDERGVLKRQVPHWLRTTEFRDLVIGFDDAATRHGGEGALYVRVRKGRA